MSTHKPNRYERQNQLWNAVSGAHRGVIQWPAPVVAWANLAPENASMLARFGDMINRRHTNEDLDLCGQIVDSVDWGSSPL